MLRNMFAARFIQIASKTFDLLRDGILLVLTSVSSRSTWIVT
jgi:hypothetical protein